EILVGVDLLLDPGELYQLLRELVGIHRRQRILVLQLRCEQRQEGVEILRQTRMSRRALPAANELVEAAVAADELSMAAVTARLRLRPRNDGVLSPCWRSWPLSEKFRPFCARSPPESFNARSRLPRSFCSMSSVCGFSTARCACARP